jgi:predicted NBD/HSP70 family sugar kinase
MAQQPGTPRLLRAINDEAALRLLLERGPLSRTDIGALTGLSKPTASQLLGRLEAAGLVVTVGHREGGRGPSAQLYQVNPVAGYVAALDVTTPTRIVTAVADITGRIIAERTVPSAGRSSEPAASRVRAAVETTAHAAGQRLSDLRHVTVGIPGALNPRTGRISYGRNLAGWHDDDMLRRLRAALDVPVSIENNVNLAGLAELRAGRAAATPNFVLLWVASGIGLALMIDGRPLRGATGGAGEVGYMPMPGAPLARNVARGANTGFQAAVGGRAVLELARTHGIPGGSAATAIRRACAGAPGGHGFLGELAGRLAAGLAVVVSVLDPELIVLAGDVPLAGGDELRRRIAAELRVFSLAHPPVELSTVPGNPVLLGALHASLEVARDELFGGRTPPDVPWHDAGRHRA